MTLGIASSLAYVVRGCVSVEESEVSGEEEEQEEMSDSDGTSTAHMGR